MYPAVPHMHEDVVGSMPAPGLPGHVPKQPYVSPTVVANSVRGHALPRKWSTGLCHCCDDPSNCFITWFCPCITFGQVAEIVNRGSPTCAQSGTIYGLLLLTGFPCLYSCFIRSKMRGQYDLQESPCVDCLVHFFCETCALCQEYRELKDHGYDMGIGWEANMDRQRRGVIIAPPVVSGMAR